VRSLLLLALVSCAASAQGFDLERLSLNPGARETWLAQTGDGLEPMHLRVWLLGHYQHLPLIYTVDGSAVGAYVRSRWTAHVVGAFGLHKYFDVGLQVPVVLSQSGDELTRYGQTAVVPTAMGAPWVAARSTVLRQSDELPVDLAISVGVSLPFGSSEALTRDPGAGFAFAPKLGVARAFGPVRVGAELGVLVRGAQVLSPASPKVSDEIGSQFSGALVFSTTGLPVHAELAARVTAPFTTTGPSLEVLGALGYSFAKTFEVTAMGGPGIGKAPGTPAFRVLFGAAWTPDLSPKN